MVKIHKKIFHSRRSTYRFFVILLTLLVITLGLAFLWTRYETEQKLGFKPRTYTNIKYNYSIKYPQAWNISVPGWILASQAATDEKVAIGEQSSLVINDGNKCDDQSNLDSCPTFRIQVSDLADLHDTNWRVYEAIKDINSAEFFNNKYGSEFEIQNTEQIILSGANCLSYDYLSKFPNKDNKTWENIIICDKDNLRYELAFTEHSQELINNSNPWSSKQLYSKILSTFKFINR